MSSNLFFDMNPLDTYFVNQSHNPGKLTFVNASFWEKRTAIQKPRRPFNFDLKTYPSRTILREVSRVSSLILRAKPRLAKNVLRHGKSFCRSGSQTLFFGGREATTGNASAVRRLAIYRPQSETTSIPVTFIWESPGGGDTSPCILRSITSRH